MHSISAFLRRLAAPKYDPKELALGKKTEREHKGTVKKIRDDVKKNGTLTLSDDDIFQSIATDHLDEHSKYYSEILIPAEKGAEKKASGLKTEMVKHLKSWGGPEANDFDIEAAIYWFANDYHGGQDTELYSILSTSKFKPGPTHRSVKDEGETAEMMYEELEKKFKALTKPSKNYKVLCAAADIVEHKHESQHTDSDFSKDKEFIECLNKTVPLIKNFLKNPPNKNWVKVHDIQKDLAYLAASYPNPFLDENTHPNDQRKMYKNEMVDVYHQYSVTSFIAEKKEKFAANYLNKKLEKELVTAKEDGLYLNIPKPTPKPKKNPPLSPGYTDEDLDFS